MKREYIIECDKDKAEFRFISELVRCKDCDHMKVKRFVYADGRIEYYRRCELDNRERPNCYFCADGERE